MSVANSTWSSIFLRPFGRSSSNRDSSRANSRRSSKSRGAMSSSRYPHWHAFLLASIERWISWTGTNWSSERSPSIHAVGRPEPRLRRPCRRTDCHRHDRHVIRPTRFGPGRSSRRRLLTRLCGSSSLVITQRRSLEPRRRTANDIISYRIRSEYKNIFKISSWPRVSYVNYPTLLRFLSACADCNAP